MHTLSSGKKEAWLSWFLRGLLILLFLILLAKLFEVQIIKGNFYRKLSQENRIRHVMLPAPRGKILARGGEEIAGNVETKKSINFTNQKGFTLSDDLTNSGPDQIVTDYKRVYPMGNKFSQALGYVSQVGEGEIGKIDPNCPEKGPHISNSLVGKTGLEEKYNCFLSGTPGEELIEVDASGKQVRILGRRAPIPGRDLKTTINYGLQTELSVAMSEMKGDSGAAIVTDPEGQILAFYSHPSFDPNIFVSKGNSDEISGLLTNTNLPFYNRVISGTFHPGSVFKPVVAIAALEQGVIDKNFTYNDQGVITVNNFSYRNWYFTEYGRTEGSVDLVKALARSTDTFFYTIGQLMGPDVLAKWSKTFGLDTQTGIDIPNETHGLIPTPEWKEKTIKEPWYLGNTYNMSIGQGDVSVTPIEINTYISAISAGGKFCKPRFNMEIPASCKTISVSQKNLDLVRDGMEAACTTGGTAFTFFDFKEKHNGVSVACKTGTAEVGTDGMPHAWFTFFAPADNPKIIATVLVEKGGEGSSIAGPIARKIADYYFASQ